METFFLINQFESHYLTQIDQQKHERIILSIDPEYLNNFYREDGSESLFRSAGPICRISSISPQKNRPGLSIFIHKLRSNSGFGEDVLDRATFLELMVFLNNAF